MKYNPEIHHRRSIRLKKYDYSQNGAYFVTIVAQERACLFGDIVDQKMVLNDAGRMIKEWIQEIPNKFHNILINHYQVMPNHFHGIIQNVGADLCVCPITDDNVGADLCVCPITKEKPGEHIGSPLHGVVQWFKTMTTDAYIQGVKNQAWTYFAKKLWQRNYYERIIRDENELEQVREYILQNPLTWEFDQENPEHAAVL